jgi:hypothetical protein
MSFDRHHLGEKLPGLAAKHAFIGYGLTPLRI